MYITYALLCKRYCCLFPDICFKLVVIIKVVIALSHLYNNI